MTSMWQDFLRQIGTYIARSAGTVLVNDLMEVELKEAERGRELRSKLGLPEDATIPQVTAAAQKVIEHATSTPAPKQSKKLLTNGKVPYKNNQPDNGSEKRGPGRPTNEERDRRAAQEKASRKQSESEIDPNLFPKEE